uniref:Uncharacterized protein n=1 Tax=Anguilla anguilla TaxID=7936 RepID=A0A0E9XR25_ANGAN
MYSGLYISLTLDIYDN